MFLSLSTLYKRGNCFKWIQVAQIQFPSLTSTNTDGWIGSDLLYPVNLFPNVQQKIIANFISRSLKKRAEYKSSPYISNCLLQVITEKTMVLKLFRICGNCFFPIKEKEKQRMSDSGRNHNIFPKCRYINDPLAFRFFWMLRQRNWKYRNENRLRSPIPLQVFYW